MPARRSLGTVALIVFLLPASLRAADAPVVYRGAKILTAAGQTFDPGVLVVQDRKIAAVGPVDGTVVPEGAEIRDVSGKVIIPGLVDSHSHLGVYSRPAVAANRDGNEMTGPVQSIVRALDSLNPFDPGIRMANAGGVTTANIMPGSGNVIGGQTIYVKLRGYTPEQMWIASTDNLGGLKMANGENPKRSYGGRGQSPGSRMKIAALQRAEFIKAEAYLRKWDDFRTKIATDASATPPDVDLGLETLVEVLQKKRTVHFHTHRADDILTVLRLKEEFGFEVVLQHGTESFKVLDQIAAAQVPVSLTIVDSPGGKAEVVDFTERCAAELAAAGIKVLINTDDPVTESRFLLRTAAIAVRGGLSEEDALKAVTINPAEVMHLADRVGSLAAGKDADFVVLSGPPFSVYTRVLETYIDGQQIFNLADDRQRLYQTGGFALQSPLAPPAATPHTAKPVDVTTPVVPDGRPAPNADSTAFAIVAGRLHTIANGTIENGVVVIRDGKIEHASAVAGYTIPEAMPVVAAAEVTPGLIDAHTVVPLDGQYNIPADSESNETSDPNQADVRTLDGFNPSEPLLRYLLEQGITVVHACPGRSNVIAGLTGVFRTHGRSAEAMALAFPHAMLFNLGDSPKEAYDGKRPGTRMGTAALVRESLSKAVAYRRKLESVKEGETPPDRDLKLDALSKVVSQEIPAFFCAQRADDILSALRISGEFKLKARIGLGAEAYLVADEIKKATVPVTVHPTQQRVGDIETYNTILGNSAALAAAGIPIALSSGVEDYVPKTRVVRHEAALAAVHGLGVEGALRAITLDAATLLGVAERLGSLEAGKIADVVLYDGDPFENATHVTHVIVDGKLVYNRAEQPQIPLADRMFYSSPELPCCLE